MSEWKEITLGRVANIQTGPFGSQLHEHDYVEVGTPIITVEHLINDKIDHAPDIPKVADDDRERLIKYTLQEGDIVFSRVGAVDRCAYVSHQEDGWMFSGRLLRVRANGKNVDAKFLYFYLSQNSVKEFIRRIAVGTTMPSLNTDLLSKVPLLLPDLDTQKSIAVILTKLDDKISLLHRQNQTLEQIAQALFKRWFVEFEFPNEHGQPYKSSGGKMAASELGEIPEGWRVGRFFDGFELLGGGTPKTSETDYWDGKIKWLSAKDITPNHKKFILKTEKTITGIGLKNSAAKLLPKFTTVISARGTVGNYCILAEEMCISQSNYGIRSKNKNRSFFTFLFIANVIDRLKAQAYGSVFDTITSYTFRDLEIIQPDEKIIDEFENMICSFFQKMLNNEKEIQNLTIIRETLLPKLMSGQIRVAG